MRSNTTFHPEILFDWPPWMFHVLLEEHRKICVKVMLSWMWWLCSSWHVVPVRVIVSRSRASSGSQLPILRLGLTPAPGLSREGGPHPAHTPGRHIPIRGSMQGATTYSHMTIKGVTTNVCIFSPFLQPLPPIIPGGDHWLFTHRSHLVFSGSFPTKYHTRSVSVGI